MPDESDAILVDTIMQLQRLRFLFHRGADGEFKIGLEQKLLLLRDYLCWRCKWQCPSQK